MGREERGREGKRVEGTRLLLFTSKVIGAGRAVQRDCSAMQVQVPRHNLIPAVITGAFPRPGGTRLLYLREPRSPDRTEDNKDTLPAFSGWMRDEG